MNESDIEKKLRSIAPARPSRSLEARIARDLTVEPAHAASGVISTAKPSWLTRVLAPLGWAAAGATAAVITMMALDHRGGKIESKPGATPDAVAAAVPAGDVQREMLDVADEGILDDATSGPSRIVRYTSLERRQWSEPGGAVMLVEVPREEILLVPVSFQ